MNTAKQKMLEKRGWKVGTAEEFLGLSPAESKCIEVPSRPWGSLEAARVCIADAEVRQSRIPVAFHGI
jgi:hypothetical protein